MKEVTGKKKQSVLSALVAVVLCFIAITPSESYGTEDKDDAGNIPAVEMQDEKDKDFREKLPAYALLPDGTPNPAFTDSEGKLVITTPEEYEEILESWKNPDFDTEGLPTLEELLGFIPADPPGYPQQGVGAGFVPGEEAGPAAEPGANAPDGSGNKEPGANAPDSSGNTMPDNDYSESGDTEPVDTEPDETTGLGIPQLSSPIEPVAITPPAAAVVDFPYFFHLGGQPDPYGSGHTYRQYYVPAGSDVPLLSFCLEINKNAPPDSQKIAYTPMAAPGWSTALATFAPAILKSYGIDTISDNAHRQWAMQDAVWLLQGANIGVAANEPVIKSLVAAANGSVNYSDPVFVGMNGDVEKAQLFGTDLVRYGPFSVKRISENAVLSIYTDDGKPYTAAWLGNEAGERMANQTDIVCDQVYYIYIPRNLYFHQRINARFDAAYILPETMSAFRSPDPQFQNQIVMHKWTENTGTLSRMIRLGGYGEFEISKLDAGWQPGFSDETYLLEGAKFKIQERNSQGYFDNPSPVVYDKETKTYRTGFLYETLSNSGIFRIVELNPPYGYRDPIIIVFHVRARYNLKLHGPAGADVQNPGSAATAENSDDDGTLYALNTLLNVRIKIQKRDKKGIDIDSAEPQGDASLSGAYYGLYYSEAVTDPSGIKHKADELVCIGITDKNGDLIFDNSDADLKPGDRRLIWNNTDGHTNYGTEDFPIFLPVFERKDPRIYPAKYYVQELVPSPGYLLDIDPETAILDSNGIPLPGTGTARKYYVDASDNGTAVNPGGIFIEKTVTEQVKMRGFLLRKIRGDGYETEVYSLNGAGFSVYLIDDLIRIIEKAAETDPDIIVPKRGPGGWDKQDFIDFFYDEDYVFPRDENTGKDWYNRENEVFKGRYNFDLYPELKRARIGYVESPVFYSGAGLVPGLRYGAYGQNYVPNEGEVIFPEFPYGEYIVFETFVPEGLDRIKPFVVNIAEDGGDVTDGDGIYNADRPEQKWRFQFDSDMFSIRLWKKDAETGKTVIKKDAAFRIKYLGADGVEGGGDDIWVEMVISGPNGIERFGTAENPYRVGESGTLILPQKLKSGNYKLYEVEAPSGYVLSYFEAADELNYYYAQRDQINRQGYGPDADKNGLIYAAGGMTADPQPDVGIVFDINEAHRVTDFDIDSDGYDDFVIELVQFNERQKGRINIHKEKEDKDEEGKTFAFAGVRFELYAGDDILSPDGHGTIIHRKGDFITAVETNTSGNAYIKDLYLGKYILKEADIPDSAKIKTGGRLVSGHKYVDQVEIDLTPPDGPVTDEDSPFFQKNPVISVSWDMLNVLQTGEIEVKKSGETADGEEPLAGVVFEVIAAEDILDINTGEVLLKKGDIAGTIITDEEGKGRLGDLLPGDYILRETEAPEGFIFADDKLFTIKGRGHPDPFEWYSWDILNIRQKLSVVIEKIDDLDGSILSGAVFGLYAIVTVESTETEILIREAISDKNGKASFIDLSPGRYKVRELSPPPGYTKNEDFAPEVTISYEGNTVEYLTWTGACPDSRSVSVEVDKDTIKRTSAAYVSLPGQAGYNNIGLADERYRYDIDFRSTSGIWADEFVVDDPLENVLFGKVIVEELWTPVVWGDYDGLWNLWYATNKTDPDAYHSNVSAMDTNPYNPGNPDRIAAYPNKGLILLAQNLRTDRRYHFALSDFGLGEGEYITKLRFEYGRVEVGFTSKNYSDESLNGEHRTISGTDLKLPSNAANELMLLDSSRFIGSQSFFPSVGLIKGTSSETPGLGEVNEKIKYIAGISQPGSGQEQERFKEYITGIDGNIVDWTPIPGTRFYAEGAADPGYELLPASYLVSAVKPMTDVDIVSSVSACIARDITMLDYDQDAVVTREIGTFEYGGKQPAISAANTSDAYPLLLWLLVFLSSAIGLLVLLRHMLDRRLRSE